MTDFNHNSKYLLINPTTEYFVRETGLTTLEVGSTVTGQEVLDFYSLFPDDAVTTLTEAREVPCINTDLIPTDSYEYYQLVNDKSWDIDKEV